MASPKTVPQLTAFSGSVADDDIMYVVDDPAGTPADRKIKASTLVNGFISRYPNEGWWLTRESAVRQSTTIDAAGTQWTTAGGTVAVNGPSADLPLGVQTTTGAVIGNAAIFAGNGGVDVLAAGVSWTVWVQFDDTTNLSFIAGMGNAVLYNYLNIDNPTLYRGIGWRYKSDAGAFDPSDAGLYIMWNNNNAGGSGFIDTGVGIPVANTLYKLEGRLVGTDTYDFYVNDERVLAGQVLAIAPAGTTMTHCAGIATRTNAARTMINPRPGRVLYRYF